MQKTLLKYTLSITGSILALLVLHLSYGTAVASVPVSAALYGWLAFLLVRWALGQASSSSRKRGGL
ncbi:hypothetical protein [Pontibacter pamirensis]|uniref:hypothetical protein n=1 Tax=Pontibacter pamirensis TaxID=2562824 RepID=UPI00138A06B6|nr:hypothetical protein [Pontibacter pamirensis]